jgi:LacI family transcriptional regulator
VLANTDEDPERETAALTTMASERASGVILVSTGAARDGIGRLLSAGVGVVALDRRIPGAHLDTVVTDNGTAAFDAVKHLIDAGHERIAFIGGPEHLSPISERANGYRRALAQHHVPYASELVRHGNLREGGGYTFTREVLDLPDPPTAIMSLSNMTSLGVLRAVRERGLDVPAQISIVGFDDVPAGDLLEPPLTVVSQPTYDLGAKAAELLIRRLAEPSAPVREVVLGSTLVVRGSTGPVPSRSSAVVVRALE